MLRHPLFTVPVFAVLAVVDVGACLGFPWFRQAGHGLSLFLTGPVLAPWAWHGAAAVPAALLGAAALLEATLLTRLTLGLFCLILSATIPVIGILTVAALALILRRPSTGGVRAGERFVFGNPEALAARRESRAPHPVLIPLAEGFRSMDEPTLCQAILGLKYLGPVTAIAPFLRRFQQDPRTAVQFTAHAVLSGTMERLEETLHTLRQRAAADPDDGENTLALAATLAQLAAWMPPGDTTADLYRRDAAALLGGLQNHPATQGRVLSLLSRQLLNGRDSAAASLTTDRWVNLQSPGEPSAYAAWWEVLFQLDRWEELANVARRIPVPSGMAECHAFWTAPPPDDPSLMAPAASLIPAFRNPGNP